MIALEDRHRTVDWLEAACREGARFKVACEVAGIVARKRSGRRPRMR